MRSHEPLTTENYHNRLDLQRTQPMRHRAEQDRLARLVRQHRKPHQQGLGRLMMRLVRGVSGLVRRAGTELLWNQSLKVDNLPEDDEATTYVTDERVYTN